MLNSSIEQLIVSPQQQQLDLALVPYDIWGTTAHVLMLAKTGILESAKASKIIGALSELQKEWEQGDFQINPHLGAQLTLEKKIIEKAGEAIGLSTHTARSRNDQVMVTELLFLREEALAIAESSAAVITALTTLAGNHLTTVLPGYTHMQPGKPTSFGLWCLAHSDALSRATEILMSTLDTFDCSPLGSVESFGTSWPIDRQYTADLLGFSKVWEIPQDAISSRGVFQLALSQAFSLFGLAIGKLSTDLMLYSTFEYGYISFGDSVAQRLHPITGSSVMAQKRNPDALELLRALSPQLIGLSSTIAGTLNNLPSGYNRDSREPKEFISIACAKLKSGLAALKVVLEDLQINHERTRQAVIQNYSLTTDLADFVAQKSGLPYRLVYKIVGRSVDRLMSQGNPITKLTAESLKEAANDMGADLTIDDASIQAILVPENALAKRRHLGGTAPEEVQRLCQARAEATNNLGDKIERSRTKIREARARTQQAVSAVNNDNANRRTS